MLKSKENGVYAEEQEMGGGQSKLNKLALFRISYNPFWHGLFNLWPHSKFNGPVSS